MGRTLGLVEDAGRSGNIVNQVQREFNGLGQMTKEYQEHGGAVNTSTSLKVQYTYSEMASGANHSRLTQMTYPNSKTLDYNYSSGLNSTISRLSSISDSTGTVESYDYLGLFTIVKRGHSQPGVDLTFIKQSGESNGDAGDQYIGYDRFDRIADHRWRTSTTDRERFQYGYDRNGSRLYRDNTLNNSFDELYHANGASNGYDGLNQLTDFRRGALSDSNSDNIPDTVTTASRTQGWDFDALGNFDSQTTDGTGQTRSHNKQNEITSIQNATTPTYDSNGNLTKDETGRTFKYDAWNRLVEVKDSGGNVVVTYKYDGLTRRGSETKSGTTRDFYYSDQWQVLEERVSGNVKIQYVWSPVYVDAMILRDRDTDGNGSLDERLWVMHDANFNVSGLVNGSGVVVERYAYDPFGVATVYDASWNVRAGSNYAWLHLHQGGRYESLSGLYHFRHRDYSPTLGRWFENDPKLFKGGDGNLYRALNNNPLGWLDSSGLCGENTNCAGFHVSGSGVTKKYVRYRIGDGAFGDRTGPADAGEWDDGSAETDSGFSIRSWIKVKGCPGHINCCNTPFKFGDDFLDTHGGSIGIRFKLPCPGIYRVRARVRASFINTADLGKTGPLSSVQKGDENMEPLAVLWRPPEPWTGAHNGGRHFSDIKSGEITVNLKYKNSSKSETILFITSFSHGSQNKESSMQVTLLITIREIQKIGEL